jgi:2-polyprenyl-3-methyl-5-hydroxy-6-metoxy-1,4-benzoquinol methylase
MWRITAIDGSQAMLDLAATAIRRAGKQSAIQLKLAYAKATGLAAGSFDMVISNSIVHHVAEPAAFWAEVKRLSKPGGLVFMRDLSRPASDAAAAAIVQTYAGTESALLQDEFHRSLLAAYTPDEVREQLRTAGLTDLTVSMASDRHWDVFGHANHGFAMSSFHTGRT